MPLPSVLNEEGRFIHLDQISDANGRFEFHGATGDGFGIVITKDGYGQLRMGERYRNGDGVGTNLLKAKFLLQESADQGDTDASNEVAQLSSISSTNSVAVK